MTQKEYTLTIADLGIQVESDEAHQIGSQFQPFLQPAEQIHFRAVFRLTARLPELPEKLVHEDDCYRLYQRENGQLVRSFFEAPRDMTPYAVAEYDEKQRLVRVAYLPKGARLIADQHSSFFHLSFESLLIQEDRIFLHAALVRTHLGGILFSGPSGIGKSTQAGLWNRYRGGQLINGDRPIVGKGPDGWSAWGSPYAGSSRCYVNACCPVTAIVMLSQDSACSLRRLKPAEAFRALWSGATVQSWDAFFVERASRLLMELAGQVPVWDFRCTANQEAVEFLEGELRKELDI